MQFKRGKPKAVPARPDPRLGQPPSLGPSHFTTPFWHWSLHAAEARWLGKRNRTRLKRALRLVMAQGIRMPTGFSNCGAVSWMDCSRRDAQRQRGRLTRLAKPPGNDERHWLTLTHALPTPHAIRVNVAASRLRYWVLLSDGQEPVAYAARTLNVAKRVAHHDFLAVIPAHQSRGYSIQFLVNAIRLYRDLGVRQVSLTAGLTAGSAVWPKLGFRPTSSSEWDKLKKTIRDNLRTLNATVPSAYQAVHGVPLSDVVEGVLHGDDPAAVFELVDLDPRGEVATQSELRHGLGGALLQGGHWHGVLDLDGMGGQRLVHYLAKRASQGAIALPPGWSTIRSPASIP
jgi:GNAT superfamily N-acetyltransferase